jgi:hypothetical protein
MTEKIAVDRTQISAAIGRALDETRRTREHLLAARSALTTGGNVRPVVGYLIKAAEAQTLANDAMADCMDVLAGTEPDTGDEPVHDELRRMLGSDAE